MIFIDKAKLDEAVAAFIEAAKEARDTSGGRLLVGDYMKHRDVEKALLGALYPFFGSPLMPSDMSVMNVRQRWILHKNGMTAMGPEE